MSPTANSRLHLTCIIATTENIYSTYTVYVYHLKRDANNKDAKKNDQFKDKILKSIFKKFTVCVLKNGAKAATVA